MRVVLLLLLAVGAAGVRVRECAHYLGETGVCHTSNGLLGDLGGVTVSICTGLRRPPAGASTGAGTGSEGGAWRCPPGYTACRSATAASPQRFRCTNS